MFETVWNAASAASIPTFQFVKEPVTAEYYRIQYQPIKREQGRFPLTIARKLVQLR